MAHGVAQVSEAQSAKGVSENPLDYLSMIVYVKRGVAVCDRLRARCADLMDVMVQDVDEIQGARPPWLRGVPTVVTLPDRKVVAGTAAVAIVEDACQSALLGCNSFEGCAAASLQEGSVNAPHGFASLFTCDSEDVSLAKTLPAADSRYQDAPKEKQHDTSLEEIMRRRGGV